jgi:hypothetical protein
MPRYYFDLDSPTIRAVDDSGDLLASDDLALEYAFTVLCENMRGPPAPRGTNLVVTVRDDTGPRFQACASISVGAVGVSIPMSPYDSRGPAAIDADIDPSSMSQDMNRTRIAPTDPR